jgi:ribulose-phosphate 3-epimerase
MIYIAPSVLAADFSQLTNEIIRVQRAGANMLHLDVMDGHFVPNISFGAPVIASMRKRTGLLFDVHLMITDPQRYINDFLKAGADSITIHVESCDDPMSTLNYLGDVGCRAAIAISPNTPAETVFPFLDKVAMVLVMTVHPGFGGQKFMPEMMEKVRAIRAEIIRRELDVDIQVDGGIGVNNIGIVTEAGANVIVAGSSIFGAKKTGAVIKAMREEAAKHPYKA